MMVCRDKAGHEQLAARIIEFSSSSHYDAAILARFANVGMDERIYEMHVHLCWVVSMLAASGYFNLGANVCGGGTMFGSGPYYNMEWCDHLAWDFRPSSLLFRIRSALFLRRMSIRARVSSLLCSAFACSPFYLLQTLHAL